jgi:hypothetical protein
MHGGLARWLRAAGYDAAWEYGIEDRALLERARSEGRTILTSDGPFMERRAIREGEVEALFVPRGLDSTEALGFVLRALRLPLRTPRCMGCAGNLIAVDKASIASEAPPKAYAMTDAFYRCSRCGKLYWDGTHWRRIVERLDSLGARRVPASTSPARKCLP